MAGVFGCSNTSSLAQRAAGRAWPSFCPAGFSTGFLCLRSAQAIPFLVGVLTLGVVHHTLTVKGSHLASHNALTESKSWGKVWAIFFIEVSGAAPKNTPSASCRGGECLEWWEWFLVLNS